MSDPVRFHCPVPGCTADRLYRRKILEHLRIRHKIPLTVYTAGLGNWKDLRRKHIQEYAAWLEKEGYDIELSFFSVDDAETGATKGGVEGDEEIAGGQGSDGEEDVNAGLSTLQSYGRETTNRFRGLKLNDEDIEMGDAEDEAEDDRYENNSTYMGVLRARLALFCDEHDQPTGVIFDLEHMATLICNADDLAIDRWENFCERRRWTEHDVEWMKTYVFKIVAQWRGAFSGRHVIDELISQFTSCFDARSDLMDV